RGANPPVRRPCAWLCCSRGTASIRRNGGPRARAGRWNSARCSRRSTISARRCCSFAASTTTSQRRAISTVRRRAICSPARRSRPPLSGPNIPRPADGIPQDIAEHMKLMCDILVLGFQTDTTRITTLKLNNDHSSLRVPNLGVDYMIHHLLSHSDTADWLKVNQFFMEQVAYIARKLDAIQEGPRTLLDKTMLLFCSSMLTGNHDATQLPVLLLGGAGGRVQGG